MSRFSRLFLVVCRVMLSSHTSAGSGSAETGSGSEQTASGSAQTGSGSASTGNGSKSQGDTNGKLKAFQKSLRALRKRVNRLEDRMSRLEEQDSEEQLPGNCFELMQTNPASGVQTVTVSGQNIDVYCDQTTDGGGWTLFQRREDGSVDFYRSWAEYETGFGQIQGEHWLGDSMWNTGASNTVLDNQPFSTYDSDNDAISSFDCAQAGHGAWWYNACAHSNLNGRYFSDGRNVPLVGIRWYHYHYDNLSMVKTEMKIRPKQD